MWITIFGYGTWKTTQMGHVVVTRSTRVLFDFEGNFFGGNRGSCNVSSILRGCKQDVINMYLARDDDDAFLYGEPKAEAQTAVLIPSGKNKFKYVLGLHSLYFCLPNIIQRELTLCRLMCDQRCNRKSFKVRETNPY